MGLGFLNLGWGIGCLELFSHSSLRGYYFRFWFSCKSFVVCRKTAASYRELEARKARVNDLEKLYKDMALGKELQVSTFYIRRIPAAVWIFKSPYQ